jgi:pilus assembly protein FimV
MSDASVAGSSTIVEELPADSVDTDLLSAGETTAELGPDEDDPLAEVNVYLAYERFDQAEHLVRDAIESHPQRHDYKLKLLEVFYAAKNVAGFEAASSLLKSAVGDDDPMLQQAREWWDDLGTGRGLFESGDTPAGDEALTAGGAMSDAPTEATAIQKAEGSGVDFDLGADDASGSSDSGVDFDLGDLDTVVTGGDSDVRETALDFDLGTADDDGSETGLDFDLGSLGDEGARTDTASSLPERAGAADTGLDFDLGSLDETPRADRDETAVDMDLSDTFTAQDASGAVPGDAGGASRAGAGTDLDFDLSDTISVPPPGTGSGGPAVEGDDGPRTELDFDLGETGTAMGSTTIDAGGTGSVLDFDLGDTGSVEGVGEDDKAGTGSVLDFDLGDTGSVEGGGKDDKAGTGSVLDFDLGDTGNAGESGEDDKVGAGSVLDFDLGDTTAVLSDTPLEGVGTESALDFDLGDTSGAGGSDEQAAPGAASDLDFDLGETLDHRNAGGSSGTENAIDFDLGDTGAEAGSDAASGLDLELNADDGEISLDLDLTGDFTGDFTDDTERTDDLGTVPPGPSIDTVQLSPTDTGVDGDSPEEDGSDEDSGVDTEFLSIFSGDDGVSSDESGLDLDLGNPDLGTGLDDDTSTGTGMEFSLQGGDEDDANLALDGDESGQVDEMQAKLDLAQAYMDMGDSEGARNLLGEVMADGSDAQQGEAREMLQRLT